MKEYVITASAGKSVAGKPNTGTGEVLTLKETAAEHAVRLGHLVLKDKFHPLDRDFDGKPGGSRPRRRRKQDG